MINLGELFVDRRTPWQKFRDRLTLTVVVLLLAIVFGAGIFHIAGAIFNWH